MARVAENRGEVAAAAARSFATNIRRALVDMLVRREECTSSPGFDSCAKPALGSKYMTWIIVGTVLGLVAVITCAVLIWFHLRRKKRDAREDGEDRFHNADYGLDEVPAGRKPPADDETGPHNGSSNGGRQRDPLHPGAGQMNGHSNQFDDASSTGSSQAWPRREGSKPSPLGKEI